MIAVIKTEKRCASFEELLRRTHAGEEMTLVAGGQRYTLTPVEPPAVTHTTPPRRNTHD